MPMHESTITPTSTDSALQPPLWVAELLGGKTVTYDPLTRNGVTLGVVESLRWTLVSARVVDAAALDRQAFQHAAAEAYVQVRAAFDRSSAAHPVRMWNYIPDMRRRYEGDIDQYMVFNAGRYAAYASWYGDVRWAERSVPTASAVGHDGADLLVHALSAVRPGKPVENPRQVSAYHYSQRYGPKPPCFARATVIEPAPGVRRVLVAGTASVVGEDSRHDDLSSQMDETLTNLSQLLHTAGVEGGLSRFIDLRVYYVRPGDLPALRALARKGFPASARVEWVRAELCRPELLVEIEGVAE